MRPASAVTDAHDLDAAITRALDAKTKPPGSLGRMEALAERIARARATCRRSPR